MTHKDIYIKFMIEYDKANVTSSYPSLTEYEVATVLDKAYNALIAQKVTGNNFRRSTFESDIKSIADLQPLIKSVILEEKHSSDDNFNSLNASLVSNTHTYDLNINTNKFLYFLQCYITKGNRQINKEGNLDLASTYLNREKVQQKIIDIDIVRAETQIDAKVVVEGDDCYPFKDISPIKLDKACVVSAGIDGDNIPQGTEVIAILSENGYIDENSEIVSYDQGEVSFVFNPDNYQNKNYVTFALSSQLQSLQDIIYANIQVYHNEQQELLVLPVKLLNHELVNQFYVTGHNLPWIKDPVCYLENDELVVVSDPYDNANTDKVQLLYIKQPNLFVKSEETLSDIVDGSETKDAGQFSVTDNGIDITDQYIDYQFELNDTMAEELISLAIAFALENVESPRLTPRLNMRGLEA